MGDPRQPGLFSCQVSVGALLYEDDYADTFQVAVDRDAQQVFYPEAPLADMPGQCIVWPPDGSRSENKFLIRRAEQGELIDIFLDLNAEDQRKMVTWAPASLPGLEDARQH